MSNVGATTTPGARLIRLRWHMRGLVRAVTRDPLTTAIVVLLAFTWLIAGTLDLAGLPHKGVNSVELLEALLCVYLAYWLVRAKRLGGIPVLFSAYVLWVIAGILTGIGTSTQTAAIGTSFVHFLLLPLLAFLLASLGENEWRARSVAASLLALTAFEFLITPVQAARSFSPDQIVGTFGPSANAVVAAVVMLAVCVAVAGYLLEAPWGRFGLALAAVLPLWAAWGYAKVVPVFLSASATVVVAGALIARRTTRRRAAVALATILLSSAAVLGWYAAAHPASLRALISLRYLRSGSVSGSTLNRVELNKKLVADYVNASLSESPRRHKRAAVGIRNAEPGDYTIWLGTKSGNLFRVRPRRLYTFRIYAEVIQPAHPHLEAQIGWQDASGSTISTTHGQVVRGSASPRRYRRLMVVGRAPPGAALAMPRLTITMPVASPSSARVYAPRFRRGGHARRQKGKKTQGGGKQSRPSTPPTPASTTRVYYGRLTQWRLAVDEISGSSPIRSLFGKGTGSATVAENLGVNYQDLPKGAAAASNSDFGTLLVERGWTGLSVVALLGIALAAAALRIARVSRAGLWTTAFTLAVPGAVCLMAMYGMIAAQLRSRPAALTFWLIIAIGLSPGAFLVWRPRLRRTRKDVAAPPRTETP